MKIKYLGHASFLLTTQSGTRIITDPYDPGAYPDSLLFSPINEPADVVTLSHEHGDHGAAHLVPGKPVIIHGNGKYVADGVDFLGVAAFYDGNRGARRGKNTVFVISADGLDIAHFGDLGHVLSADQAAEIGAVDVALLPVGGFYTIDAAQAWKVAEQVSARIVIPMHYKTDKCLFPIAGVEDFIAGRSNVECKGKSTIEVTTKNLPNEQTVVVLEAAN